MECGADRHEVEALVGVDVLRPRRDPANVADAEGIRLARREVDGIGLQVDGPHLDEPVAEANVTVPGPHARSSSRPVPHDAVLRDRLSMSVCGYDNRNSS